MVPVVRGAVMGKGFARYGLGAGILIGLGLVGAEASVIRPPSPAALGVVLIATPTAMCGYSCRSGGRYIPGPPSVCYERGLTFCGPSRGWGGLAPRSTRDTRSRAAEPAFTRGNGRVACNPGASQ